MLGVVTMVGIALGACRAAALSIPFDVGCSFENRFSQLPADDAALRSWLEAQPGIYRVFVLRRDQEAERHRLEVSYGISSNGWRYPHDLPDLDSKCRELGYSGNDTPFQAIP